MPRPCHALTMRFFSRPRHGRGMASVNQTRPHCVNQTRKTHSKPLAARHAMCESVFRASNLGVACASHTTQRLSWTQVPVMETNVTCTQVTTFDVRNEIHLGRDFSNRIPPPSPTNVAVLSLIGNYWVSNLDTDGDCDFMILLSTSKKLTQCRHFVWRQCNETSRPPLSLPSRFTVY